MSISPETGALLDELQQLVWTGDSSGKYCSVNATFVEYTGLPESALLNRGWQQTIHPHDRERVTAHWKSVLAHKTDFDIQYRIRRHDGYYRYFQANAKRLPSNDGAQSFFIGTCIDIDDYHRREEFLRFTADVGASLSTTLDLDRTLSRAARLSVPRIADWCILFMCNPDGSLGIMSAEHEQSDYAEIAATLFKKSDVLTSDALRRIVDHGEPLCFPTVSIASFAKEIGLKAESPELRQLDPRSALYIPLSRKGRVIAVLLMVCASSGRQFAASDVHFAKVIAKRSSKILESADRFERDQRVATRLQEASLPRTLPEIEGFVFDAMYVAARDDAQIGGDWYDAFCLPDGRLVVTIGDVSGNGLEAAVVMSSARQILRGAAHLSPDPVTMLDAADRALRDERPQSFVTAFVAIFDTVSATLTYASAGHPWPFVRNPDGSVTELQATGLPLGIRPRSTEPSNVLPLQAGSSFVFYTDGLIESTRDILSGTRRVIGALEGMRTGDYARLAHLVHKHVIGSAQTFDDIAILSISIGPEVRIGTPSWSCSADDAQQATAVRKALCEELALAGAKEHECTYAELVFIELIANVMRHTPGKMDVTLNLDGQLPVLHVRDQGPGFRFNPRLPGDLFAENGRGLYLVASLTEDFTVSPRSDGGSHARAVLQVTLPPRPHRRPRQAK